MSIEQKVVPVPSAEQDRRDALGDMVRTLRLERGWTLAEASRHCGLAISTLSKVENNRLSLTFDNLFKLAVGFGIDVGDLFAPTTAATDRQGMKGGTPRGHGSTHETANYVHEYLCTDLARRRMIPIVSRIKARTLEEFGPLLRHAGQEFVYVLEGAVSLVLEGDEPRRLRRGNSFYFDSSVGHAVLCAGRKEATVLSVLWAPDMLRGEGNGGVVPP